YKIDLDASEVEAVELVGKDGRGRQRALVGAGGAVGEKGAMHGAAQLQRPMQVGEYPAVLFHPFRGERDFVEQHPQRRVLELVAQQDEVVLAGGHGADLEFDLAIGLLAGHPVVAAAFAQATDGALRHGSCRSRRGQRAGWMGKRNSRNPSLTQTPGWLTAYRSASMPRAPSSSATPSHCRRARRSRRKMTASTSVHTVNKPLSDEITATGRWRAPAE